jgi:hypothetical protein
MSVLFVVAALSACGGDGGSGGVDAPAVDAETDAPTDAGIDGPFVAPTMLSETGLYADIGAKTIAADVKEYEPRWMLWSDAATKKRWIWLPPGASIDTTDMDYWSFPMGTKIWKEFSRDGKRVETRLLEKIGPEDDVASWFMVSFQWDATESDAMAVPGGVVDDQGVNDIPDRSKCRQCHGPNRNKSIILGFQALQLDYDAASYLLDLNDLVTQDLLTTPPTAGTGGTFFPLPSSGAGVDNVTAAVGYLHGNCGGCHNALSDVQNTTPLQLRLSIPVPAMWDGTPTYTTAVNHNAMLNGQGVYIVHGGDTADSAIHNRMMAVGASQMPPIAREQVDTTALAAVDAWISSLPAPAPP